MFPRRTGLLAPNPARHRPAVPPGAPTRPARGMSGFWIRQVRIRLFVLPKSRSEQCSRFAGGQKGGFYPGRIDLTASRPNQPRPAPPPRRAPPRPDRPVICPGFGFDRLSALCTSTGADLDHLTIVYQQDERRSSFLDAYWMQTSMSFRIDPQGSVCTSCCTGCRVSARANCRCTRHRLWEFVKF